MKNALFIYPEFSPLGFWNYTEVCRLVGARYPAAPLGLITVAALLPTKWDIRLVDMNTTKLLDSDLAWADLVFIGGMLPQQTAFLKLIDRVHASGKRVVAGGPDPTSQPRIYGDADYLVLGEAEETITPFLQDLEAGSMGGVYFPSKTRPDMATSPTPRYDLLNFKHYMMVGIQFSRGCPFNCEFCDVIELYGRSPRTKTPEQILRELDTLYNLGYRGHVDFVDDNFIGHKGKVKEILTAVKAWSVERRYPFFFSTEASINLADDDDLLALMRDIDFRYIFIGIESADETALKSSQKKQNLNRKVHDDLHKIYRYGMVVNGGFIIGFDQETSQTARQIADAIDDYKIGMPMIGLLYALPNTQLTHRLEKEHRLFLNSSQLDENSRHNVDQATNGLNFITRRPRSEVINDFIYVLRRVFANRDYFNRCLRLGLTLETRKKHKTSFGKKLRIVWSLLKLIKALGLRPSSSYFFWRNLLIIMILRPSSLQEVANLMAMYIHFRIQTKFVIKLMTSRNRLQTATQAATL